MIIQRYLYLPAAVPVWTLNKQGSVPKGSVPTGLRTCASQRGHATCHAQSSGAHVAILGKGAGLVLGLEWTKRASDGDAPRIPQNK